MAEENSKKNSNKGSERESSKQERRDNPRPNALKIGESQADFDKIRKGSEIPPGKKDKK